MNLIAFAPSITERKSSGFTSNARYRQSKPKAAIPAFCIAGDAECLMGCPSTAQYFVAALNSCLNMSDTPYV